MNNSVEIMKGVMAMSGEKVDRLFLRASCFECGKVRAHIDFSAVSDDSFRGKEGQELRVFTALSVDSGKELLQRFGISSEFPVVLTYDGAIIAKAKNVILHLRRNGMVKD